MVEKIKEFIPLFLAAIILFLVIFGLTYLTVSAENSVAKSRMNSSTSELQKSIDITIHRPESELKLELEIEFLKKEVDRLNHEIKILESKYGY